MHPTGVDGDVDNQLLSLPKKDILVECKLFGNQMLVGCVDFVRVPIIAVQDCSCQIANWFRNCTPLWQARLSPDTGASWEEGQFRRVVCKFGLPWLRGDDIIGKLIWSWILNQVSWHLWISDKWWQPSWQFSWCTLQICKGEARRLKFDCWLKCLRTTWSSDNGSGSPFWQSTHAHGLYSVSGYW